MAATTEKPVVDFGAPTQVDDEPPAGQPTDNKPRLSKTQRKLRRWARTGYAIFVAWMPVLSFALTISSLVSASWGHKSINADDTKWLDVSPVNGNCTCDSTHVSYCAETSDAFEGTAYLSVTVIMSQLLLAFIYTCELGMYGLFGGSHDYTRITLIVALLALSTEILSVISWYATFSNDHCGDPSFESNGATLGWPFFVRCIECAGMLGFVLYITSLFPKTNRGPPSIPLVAAVFAMMITCVTTFLRGWMSNGDVSYSPWSACTCGDACSNVASMMSLALATGALAVVAGFVVIFFTSLRAVDNEGLTLKVASIASGVTLLFQILVVVGFYLAYNGGCGSSLADDGYDLFWPSNFAVSAIVTQVAFLVSNTVYTMKACCAVDEGEPEPANDYERTIFFRFWWDHLKDPRTLAHEAREEDEDDNAGSESDDDLDDDDDDMAAGKDGGEGETGKEAAPGADEKSPA
uniref:Uncharacterized protein n=1 Tax=Neobodo designis TaxID=312471 RepID=A0A7S1R4K9_NEODS|mmetsp:Transcript_8186/g.25541  ORF Transcript_8186/g.25541 Transcript_8186/m.25541 type:complete len:464 (+) Transcript_8186:196-1587(+)